MLLFVADNRCCHSITLFEDLRLVTIQRLEDRVGEKANGTLALRDVHNQALVKEVQKWLRVTLKMCELTSHKILKAVFETRFIEVDPVLRMLSIFLRARMSLA